MKISYYQEKSKKAGDNKLNTIWFSQKEQAKL